MKNTRQTFKRKFRTKARCWRAWCRGDVPRAQGYKVYYQSMRGKS